MNIDHAKVSCVKGDAILVEALLGPDKVGSFYIPDSVKSKKPDSGRRAAWRGRVVMFGDEVDMEQWKPNEVKVGDVVILAPESADCPKIYDESDASHSKPYIFVRDEDVLAKEAA